MMIKCIVDELLTITDDAMHRRRVADNDNIDVMHRRGIADNSIMLKYPVDELLPTLMTV